MNNNPPDSSIASAASPMIETAPGNLPLAIVYGIFAAIIGAVIWAAVTVATEYQLGLMAIAIGFLVGFAVRLGRGTTPIFGIVGAILSLFGCLLGNFLAMVAFAAKSEHAGVFATLSSINYAKAPDLMVSTFSAMDLVFYGIAVYEGYKFSFYRPSAEPPAPVA